MSHSRAGGGGGTAAGTGYYGPSMSVPLNQMAGGSTHGQSSQYDHFDSTRIPSSALGQQRSQGANSRAIPGSGPASSTSTGSTAMPVNDQSKLLRLKLAMMLKNAKK